MVELSPQPHGAEDQGSSEGRCVQTQTLNLPKPGMLLPESHPQQQSIRSTTEKCMLAPALTIWKAFAQLAKAVFNFALC